MKKYLLPCLLQVLFTCTTNAQWSEIFLPDYGAVASMITVHDTLYAGSFSGHAVYRSVNIGNAWQSCDSGMDSVQDCERITYNPATATWFACAADRSGFFSSRNGSVWERDSQDVYPTDYAFIGNTAFCASLKNGPFISTDSGSGWTSISSNLPTPYSYSKSICAKDSVLILNAGGHTYRSVNIGASWILCDSGMGTRSINRFFVTDSFIFAAFSDYPWAGGIGRSADNGVSWDTLNSGLPTGAGVWDFIEKGDSLFVCGYPFSVYLSADHGKNWQSFSLGLPPFGFYALGIQYGSIFAADGIDLWRYIIDSSAIPLVATNDSFNVLQRHIDTLQVTINDSYPFTGTTCITSAWGSARFSISNCIDLVFHPDSAFVGKDTCWYMLCNNGLQTICDTAMVIVKVDSCRPEITVRRSCQMFYFPGYCSSNAVVKYDAVYADSVEWHISYPDTILHGYPLLYVSYREGPGTIDSDHISTWSMYNTICATAYNQCGKAEACCIVRFLWDGNDDIPSSYIQVYPNPATGILRVDAGDLNPQTMAIFNIDGQKISETKFTPQTDVHSLSPGIYFIELRTNEFVGRKRFVKM